ncbi:MAG TPA: hypothetical protein PLD95_00755 [bacterium]|jgi:hypothetical protein|nr:hypothetical protein [bacterium]HOG37983.1 hypothetical protein [bacterium]HQI03042.1 hypothetical protein [bacterium]
MPENTKKIILILLFLAVSIGMAFLIYFTFFARKQEPISSPIDTTPSDVGFPDVGIGGPQIIDTGGETIITTKPEIMGTDEELVTNSQEVVGKNIASINTYSAVNNGVVYYDNLNQSFFKVSGDGTISKLSDRKFYSVTNATFSPTKNQAILEYPDNTKVLYDFEREEFIARFPQETQDFAFSETGDKLSYKWMGDYEDQNYLVTSNSDASNFKFIRPIADQARNIKNIWSPNGEVMATFRKQYDLERQEIYFINEDDKNLRSLVVDGFNFDGMWNTQGDKLLYNVTSQRSDFKPTLWFANGQGDDLGYGKVSMGINTWINKCSFSQSNNDVVYCAVPDSMPRGAGLNPGLASGIPYSIYKINISTGNQQIIAQPMVNNNRISIDKIYTNQNDSQMYYIDSSTGYLYSIDLK